MSLSRLSVAVIGLGTAGQAAAVLLARDGHRVEVFEQAAAPGPVGAGVLLQPVGLQALWKMGLLDEVLRHVRRIDRLYGDTPKGKGVLDIRYARLDPRLYGLGLQRGALFSILASVIDPATVLHADSRVVDADSDNGRVRDVHGKSHGPFDLIVVADGSASSLRCLTGNPRLDRPYPWGALWCLLEQGDWAFGDELRQRYVGAQRMIGMLPVGTRPGDDVPRLSFFWSLPTRGMDGWTQAPFAAWLDEVRDLWPESAPRLCGLRAHSALSRASYRDAIPRAWHKGRLVLLGDAAHAMSPQLGQGVNMALLDALALRDALRAGRSLRDALESYARQRSAQVSAYQFWSRWLTPLFQSHQRIPAWVRDLTFLQMGRLWGARSLMLRVLSGTQQGMFGTHALEPEFLDRNSPGLPG